MPRLKGSKNKISKKIKIICHICKKEFWVYPYRKTAKFCSNKCRGVVVREIMKGNKLCIGRIPWNKGKKRPPFSKKWREKMSLSRKGEKHWNWKGGIRKSYQGYIFIYSPNHPYKNQHNAVKRCHLVMEKILGRYLQPREIVHHINGIKDDDRPENLQLFANKSKHFKRGHFNIKRNKIGQFV